MSTTPGHTPQQPSAIVVRTRRELTRGLVWVEVYRPFDLQAWQEWSKLVLAAGSHAAAAELDPALASRALGPVDMHKTGMLAPDLERFAREYLVRSRRTDRQHDTVPREDVRVVESFINGPEVASPNFWPGAWVAVLEIDKDSKIWRDVESGVLNGVSIMAFAAIVEIVADVGEST